MLSEAWQWGPGAPGAGSVACTTWLPQEALEWTTPLRVAQSQGVAAAWRACRPEGGPGDRGYRGCSSPSAWQGTQVAPLLAGQLWRSYSTSELPHR